MTPEAINSIIGNLANRLGVTVEYLYPLLIRQAYIDGIRALMWIVLCIAFLVAIYKWIKYVFFTKNAEGDTLWEKSYHSDTEIFHVITLIALGILSIIFIITIGSNLDRAINAFSNPEWYAIQQLFRQFQ